MDPVVITSAGKVRGEKKEGIFVFRGIPYAAAPVGKHRFRPPSPPECWSGVRDALEFGQCAPQSELPMLVARILAPTIPTGEDCLNLNVWTPQLGEDAKLPVLVWIHGGGFLLGSGSDLIYDGCGFAQDGVVTVTLNYRLDALGFLFVGDEGAGNYGILDQIAALKWVHENIAAFGGDASKITIAGESAGGWSVGALLGSPKAKGLFRRAILMSGSAHHHVPLNRAEWRANRICGELGVGRSDLTALQALPSSKILQASLTALRGDPFTAEPDHFGPDPIRSWLHCGPVVGTDALPEPPYDAVAKGAATGIDLLIGHTLDEGRLFLLEEPTRAFTESFGDDETTFNAFAGSFAERGIQAQALYRANRPGATRFDLLSALMGDLHFRLPAIRLADVQARHAEVYFYRFSWPSPLGNGAVGSTHVLELPFVWGSFESMRGSAMGELLGDDPPKAISNDMHRAWVSFIQTGKPGHGGIPTWPKHGADRPVMDFNAHTRLLSNPAADETAIWNDVPFL